MGLQDKLNDLLQQGLKQVEESVNLESINDVRVKMLGKKGPITEVLRGMRDLSAEERPKVGQFANEVRDQLTNAIDEQRAKLENATTLGTGQDGKIAEIDQLWICTTP